MMPIWMYSTWIERNTAIFSNFSDKCWSEWHWTRLTTTQVADQKSRPTTTSRCQDLSAPCHPWNLSLWYFYCRFYIWWQHQAVDVVSAPWMLHLADSSPSLNFPTHQQIWICAPKTTHSRITIHPPSLQYTAQTFRSIVPVDFPFSWQHPLYAVSVPL